MSKMIKMTVTDASELNPTPKIIAVASQCIIMIEHDIEYIMTLVTGDKYNIKSIHYCDVHNKFCVQSIFCDIDEVLGLIFLESSKK